ncbi:MAG: mandelate racemase/muconate lactonizing enzyme family protein [Paracoccaceae bacterium]|jgi:L-alanine-DL-glutamate epimerase-like enolase superfamily enzyme|nr:mandelate racemase/muconate lactonizing enzyme family protein [Paracoccaceae bacterium]
MKLKDLKIIVTRPPPPGWGGRYWIFVKLTTDNGIVGWGECYASSIGPEAMEVVIKDIFERYFLNESPSDFEKMFRRTYSSGFTQRPDLTVMGAFSGLEIACWDILGKHFDCPTWQLLGGKINERVRAYSYLYPLEHHDLNDFWTTPEMAAESAIDLVNRGFTAVKFDPAGPYTMRGGHMPAMSDIKLSINFCRAIREAVGDNADILFGTHGQFTTAGAIRLGKAIEPYSPMWFEEPIPPDNLSEFSKVQSAVGIPIATGERFTTKMEFAEVLKSGGVSIIQPALGRAGGIWEMKKAAAIAEVFNAQVAPHLYAGPIEWAANIQLAASIPNLLIAETIETPFHKSLVNEKIKVEDGYIQVSDEAGLGIEVNEKLAEENPYKGSDLHLMMQDGPCDYSQGNSFSGGAPPLKTD